MKIKLSIFFILIVALTQGQQRNLLINPLKDKSHEKQVDGRKFVENSYEYGIEWMGVSSASISGESKVVFVTFENAIQDFSISNIPRFEVKTQVNGNPNDVDARLAGGKYQEVTQEELNVLNEAELLEAIEPRVSLVYQKKKTYAICSFIPLRKNSVTGKIEKLVAFNLDWIIPEQKGNSSTPTILTYADNSVLSSGEWYKLAVVEDGIYILSFSKLQTMGIDPSNIDPRNIRIYGNGGGMLPMQNSIARYDDLQENSILVEGESDGIFNNSDYVLFYGKSQELWTNNGVKFSHEKNLFCDTTFYYITADLGLGKRILSNASLGSYTETVTSFNERIIHEKDRSNLIKTGQDWFGEQFGIINTYDFAFQIPDIDASNSADIQIDFASHSPHSPSEFVINVNNVSVSQFDEFVTPGYTSLYAKKTKFDIELPSPSSSINVEINFNKANSSALAWLNCIEINARRLLKTNGTQMHFRDLESVGSGNVSRYQLSSSNSDHKVWDITNPINPLQQVTTFSGNTLTFNTESENLKEYIVYDGTYFLDPIVKGSVSWQDLHAMKDEHPDYIIVTHPKFIEQAEDLAQFHRDEEGFSAVVATTNEIYNEFSSGAQDVNAIRGFVKMFYDEATSIDEMPRYLLLFGDGSYDYKDRVAGNSNYVPVYQSKSSLNPTTSYCSDDFYGLLDDAEGESDSHYIDLGIGRLAVRTKQEAEEQVSKIKRYYSLALIMRFR